MRHRIVSLVIGAIQVCLTEGDNAVASRDGQYKTLPQQEERPRSDQTKDRQTIGLMYRRCSDPHDASFGLMLKLFTKQGN